MKSLQEHITEALMKFEKTFELEFTISKSYHATQRQSRHGDDEDHYISDDEILEEVKKASKTIIEDIINDHINIDDRFIARDSNTDLNIVCQLHRGTAKDKLRVDIITVIKTEKFWNTKQNWVVMIR
jgi:hypothetical protein